MAVQLGHLIAEDEVVDALGAGGFEDGVAEKDQVAEELGACRRGEVVGGGDDLVGQKHAAAANRGGLVLAQDRVARGHAREQLGILARSGAGHAGLDGSGGVVGHQRRSAREAAWTGDGVCQARTSAIQSCFMRDSQITEAVGRPHFGPLLNPASNSWPTASLDPNHGADPVSTILEVSRSVSLTDACCAHERTLDPLGRPGVDSSGRDPVSLDLRRAGTTARYKGIEVPIEVGCAWVSVHASAHGRCHRNSRGSNRSNPSIPGNC
jgi:hypothetical protein